MVIFNFNPFTWLVPKSRLHTLEKVIAERDAQIRSQEYALSQYNVHEWFRPQRTQTATMADVVQVCEATLGLSAKVPLGQTYRLIDLESWLYFISKVRQLIPPYHIDVTDCSQFALITTGIAHLWAPGNNGMGYAEITIAGTSSPHATSPVILSNNGQIELKFIDFTPRSVFPYPKPSMSELELFDLPPTWRTINLVM